jgi:hypothetical protein
MEANRFFIVSFIGTAPSGHRGTACTEFSTVDSYLNKDTTVKQLEKASGLSEVVITNIIELNKSDYNNWNREE